MSSVVLIDPKFAVNLGNVIRACAAFGITELRATGHRAVRDADRHTRLAYREASRPPTPSERSCSPSCALRAGYGVPVCVELVPGAVSLPYFEHPENAIYVFGPEDGSVPQVYRRLCHHFIVVPTHHCMNLAATVGITLYDRRMKRILAGLESGAMDDVLQEQRYVS